MTASDESYAVGNAVVEALGVGLLVYAMIWVLGIIIGGIGVAIVAAKGRK